MGSLPASAFPSRDVSPLPGVGAGPATTGAHGDPEGRPLGSTIVCRVSPGRAEHLPAGSNTISSRDWGLRCKLCLRRVRRVRSWGAGRARLRPAAHTTVGGVGKAVM